MHEFLVGQRQTRRDRRVLVGGADRDAVRVPARSDPVHQRHGVRPADQWNPFDLGNFATGTQGLVYEPLFLYDPVKNQYDPWLATAARRRWSGNKYTIKVPQRREVE